MNFVLFFINLWLRIFADVLWYLKVLVSVTYSSSFKLKICCYCLFSWNFQLRTKVFDLSFNRDRLMYHCVASIVLKRNSRFRVWFVLLITTQRTKKKRKKSTKKDMIIGVRGTKFAWGFVIIGGYLNLELEVLPSFQGFEFKTS